MITLQGTFISYKETMFEFNLNPIKEEQSIDLSQQYDLCIIGGGPAGMNAALYAKRKGLNVLIIAKTIGGQLLNTSSVDNYLGTVSISGEGLKEKVLEHIRSESIPILQDAWIHQLSKEGESFKLLTERGDTITSKTVLLAMGGIPRKLGLENEEQWAMKGLSYCAICDGPLYRNQKVVVVGGGNSALEAVVDLSKTSSEVVLVHRSQFRADPWLVDKVYNLKNVTVHLGTQIVGFEGLDRIQAVQVYNENTDQTLRIEAKGVFAEIGVIPNSRLVSGFVEMNEHGEILVDAYQRTSVKGLYAAGDITDQQYKQIIIAAAEGAKAALAINADLNQ